MTAAPPSRTRREARARRRVRRLITVALIAALVTGLAIGISAWLWPDQVGEAYGDAQIAIGRWRIAAIGEVPHAVLGASGTEQELDRCDGTFTEMLPYERDDVPPVWAAHNNCGGDVILPLEIGDQIDLERDGETTHYRVIDIRHTPKVWATTEGLIGIAGDLALQSCFYGDRTAPMKFVGLELIEAS
ncbi:hypothetical protein E4U02_10710 [Microbacterium paludicola]|uniref:Sortase n=1 Tax=Microbacterium paludicola TaxID=300019 RepID=A0A4Y9FV34_9MICO|nr:hypothetical protein [Microbacterium paludicola]MBF0816883.1 hypothetical protein [Microbacterium paludicola]TFU32404.1 hypothetical protein E4U02_10710 [Microbacterium paludicola]